jgi:arginine decarboxylase
MYQSVRGIKKECPTLDGLNIGGGFPIKNSLAFEYDYQYMIDEIINQIKIACDEAEVDVPNILLNLVPLL